MRIFFAFIASMLIYFSSAAQVFEGMEAEKRIQGTNIIRFDVVFQAATFVHFRKGEEPDFAIFNVVAKKILGMKQGDSLALIRQESDELGYTHFRYRQIRFGYPVEGGVVIVHVSDGKIISMNGKFFPSVEVQKQPLLSEKAALQKALEYVNATKYKWQLPEEEQLLKTITGKADATYFPIGEVVVGVVKNDYKPGNFRLAYKFDIYAEEPLSKQAVFVDAETGQIINTLDEIFEGNAKGTAYTRYNGTQTITTDSTSSFFRLRETGRGNGVETYNLQTGTSYGSAVDFTDGDDSWNNKNSDQDEVATDAHYGAEMTYDFYNKILKRSSYDGYGAKIYSYVHYSKNYNNAFWDGYRMTYGDGNGSVFTPLTGLDVCGHEITHGVTQYTAGLQYQGESGALNESFSDVMGTAIEFYAHPTTADYIIGKEITPSGNGLRSMANPKLFSNPMTYKGTYWYTGSGDNGGVHTNSGVQNFWFYILSSGGSGTNDNGDKYTVNGIGVSDAAKIAYRSLSNYLPSTANYADARFYSIQAARDLFGNCSNEEKQVTNAWYAAGVGAKFDTILKPDFIAAQTQYCKPPASVDFTNASTASVSYTWEFGDGGKSAVANPTHTYFNYGNYTVKMTAIGCTGAKDSVIKKDFISIDSNLRLCRAVFMPYSGYGQKQTVCAGTIYDNGGDANYNSNSNGIITIAPANASLVTLTFKSFSFEDGFDYLYIYDGPTIYSPLIGLYTGNNLPNGGKIVGKSGAITLRQTSDQYLTFSGFEADWQCVSKTPIDAGIWAVKGLKSGRENTSISLKKGEKVGVVVKNYGSSAITSLPIAYSINGGTEITDTFNGNLKAGDTASFIFSKEADLSTPGKYFFTFHTMLPNDTVAVNDSLQNVMVKQVANQPLSLPFTDGFEGTGSDIYKSNYIGIEGADKFDYSQDNPDGRLRANAGDNFPIKGNRAITLDKSPAGGSVATNYLVLTLNLENYKNNKLYLDFDYSSQNASGYQGDDVNDKVWIRGSDTSTWVQLYDLYQNRTYAGVPKNVTGLDVATLLKSNNQTPSSSTQIRFGQGGNYLAQSYNSFGGFTFDNITVWSPFDLDLGISALLTPQNGRKNTSIALGKTEPITVVVNNFGTKTQSTIPLFYSVNGGAAVKETLNKSVFAGNSLIYTFAQTADLSDTGNYAIKIWTGMTNDSAAANDTLIVIVRHIPNEDVSLPYLENFEKSGDETYIVKTVGLKGVEKFDFNRTDTLGRLRTQADNKFAKSGTHAITLDRNTQTSPTKQINYLTWTLNLSKYKTSSLYLDFDYMQHGEEQDINDKVWIRGNDKGTWIELYDLYTNGAKAGVYKSVNSLDISNTLASSGQKPTESFQILIGQEDNSASVDTANNDGISIDNLRVWGVANDVGVLAIDSPRSGCGYTANEKVSLKLINPGSVAQYVVPLAYSFNGGTVVKDTLYGALNAGDTLVYSFGKTIDLSKAGTYTLRAWTTLGGDIDHSNDTAITTLKIGTGNRPTPIINPTGPIEICQGDSIQLDAGSGYSSYQWSSGQNVRAIYVSTSGNYFITVTSSGGCVGTSPAVAVSASPRPTAPSIIQSGDSLISTSASTYQWFKDGVMIAGAIYKSFKPSASGNYSVVISQAKTCKAESAQFKFTYMVGMEEFSAISMLNIYPNPSHGWLNVEMNLNKEASAKLTLTSVVGTQVYFEQKNMGAGKINKAIDLSALPTGIYILTIEANGARFVKRVIKE